MGTAGADPDLKNEKPATYGFAFGRMAEGVPSRERARK